MDPLTIRVDERFIELSKEHEEAQQGISAEQQQELVDNWIEACGGSVEEIDYISEREQKQQSTQDQTRALIEAGKDLEEIAKERSLTVGTIVGHILAMKHRGEQIDISHIDVDEEIVETVREAYEELITGDQADLYTQDGQLKLKPLHTMLDGEVEYDDIKLALIQIV